MKRYMAQLEGVADSTLTIATREVVLAAEHERAIANRDLLIKAALDAKNLVASEADAALAEKDARIGELETKLAAAIWLVPENVLVGELRKKRDEFASLRSHAKWLRMAADEIRREGHAGWGNTCEQAADAIDAAISAATQGEK